MIRKKLIIIAFALSACSAGNVSELPQGYHEDLAAWKADRDTRLRSDNGWVNLAGLFWLDKGVNTFGSSPENDVQFPEHAPSSIGEITLKDSILYFSASPGISVIVDTAVQDSAIAYDLKNGIRPVMQHGRYRWFVIERAGNYGIRLRDLEDPRTKQPLDIEYFEWSQDWRITAKYKPFEEPKTLSIENIVGFTSDEEYHGEFVFEIDGEQYSLWPSMDDNSSWIMFADATSGDESYGSGRYLVAGVPNENNEVILDFNRAYNPPCGFTDFATCPLPPEQNILAIPVRAGEKEYHFKE